MTITVLIFTLIYSLLAVYSNMSAGEVVAAIGTIFAIAVTFLTNYRDNVKTKTLVEANANVTKTKLIELEKELELLKERKVEITLCDILHAQSVKDNVALKDALDEHMLNMNKKIDKLIEIMLKQK